MGAFDWLFGKQEIPGRAQAAFDHPKVYGEVDRGPGVHGLSEAAAIWSDDVSKAFRDAEAALDRVLKESEVLMEGAAGDRAREAARPLSQATQEAIDVAARASRAVEGQAQGSADFKNVFLEPHQVPPDNIGWSDYVNPVAFAAKSGTRAGHEELRDQIEAQARQQYEAYTRSTNERVNSIPEFSPTPKFAADVEPAKTTPVHKVEPIDSHTSTQSTRPYAEQPAVPPVADPGPPPATAAVDAAPEAPAESSSAWVAPAASGSPVGGGSAPAPGGAGGVAGGVVVPPGGSGGRPAPPGIGRGGGLGTGRGGDTGKGLPGGGRSGSGGPTPPGATGSGTPAARGAAGGGGVAGGAPAAGGRQKEEDKEHGRKFVKGDRDAWSDLEIPKVAPAVFGDWEAEALKGKPPRPPEQT